MTALLAFHTIAAQRGDGLFHELAELLERPIPRLAQPIDALSPQLICQFVGIAKTSKGLAETWQQMSFCSVFVRTWRSW